MSENSKALKDLVELQRLCQALSAIDETTMRRILKDLSKCETQLREGLIANKGAITTGEKEVDTSSSNNYHQSTMVPNRIIDLVCLSEYLTVRECGRLLLLVSKSMLHSFGENHAWEVLCCQRWRNTFSIPESIARQRGYKWIFHQLSGERFSWPLSTTSLAFDTIAMLVSIRNSDEREVVSVALKSKQLKKFLSKGELNIALNKKVDVGNFPLSEDGELESVLQRVSNWKASIVLFRSDKAECAHVHRTKSCCWGEYDYLDDPNIKDEFPEEEMATMEKVGRSSTVATVPRPKVDTKVLPMEVDMGYLEFASTYGLCMTRKGLMLEDRIRAHNVDTLYTCINIEPTLICHSEDYCESSKMIELVSTELRLDIWKRYASGAAESYHSENEERKHGVALLHLLDELQDWQ